MLISQERFEKAQEAAFEELDYEECTEEQCIVLIQEMLQVENVFSLQVIVEGNDTQLSLSWRNLDEKKKATDVCRDCDSFELNDRISILVKKLVDASSIKQVSNLSIEDMRKKVEEEERLKREKEERLNKEEENRLVKEHEKKLKEDKIEKERQSKLDVIQKEEYFENYYLDRKLNLVFARTNSSLVFEPIPDNESMNVSSIGYKGFNIGLRYFLHQNISIDSGYSQNSFFSTNLQRPELHTALNQSGSNTCTNIGASYHWYFTRWGLIAGGGITSYIFNHKFQDLSGINYELSLSKNAPYINFGLDYNLMNKIFFNVEWLVSISDSEVSYSNNPNKHKTLGNSSFTRLGIGYNF